MTVPATTGLSGRLIHTLHTFLHESKVGDELRIIVNGKPHRIEIMRGTDGVKFLLYEGTQLRQQSLNLNTVYGILAYSRKISWGTRNHIKVVDDTVYYKGKQIYPKPE